MVDEIQSGLGRSGKLLATDYENVKPDVVILGKALGGGFLPVSAIVGRKDVMDVFNPGSHGSTFGGNPLAAAVGSVALDVLIEENLIQNSATLGDYFMNLLKSLNDPSIREVRGKGLWIGVDFDPALRKAKDVSLALLKEGVIARHTHETVIRLAPPLTITKDQIDFAFKAIQNVLS
jgi:ornithine--oxo-acid transaminase